MSFPRIWRLRLEQVDIFESQKISRVDFRKPTARSDLFDDLPFPNLKQNHHGGSSPSNFLKSE